MSELRTRMLHAMIVRGMSERTQQAYLAAVVGLTRFYRRSPDQITDQEIQAYIVHLLTERKLAWSSVNVALCALRFFYHTVLERNRTEFFIPAPRGSAQLPEILSREEVARLLAMPRNLKHRLLLMTAYAAGLRVGELVHLQVRDIDSDRMTLRVEQGKGAQDRYTLLSPRLLDELRAYWRCQRPRSWLFPSRDRQQPLTVSTPQRVYRAAKRRAGIGKRGGIHALRHAFATHLLESGVDLHTIQRLLGHRHIHSTMGYFHLARRTLSQHASPLDLLPAPEALRE